MNQRFTWIAFASLLAASLAARADAPPGRYVVNTTDGTVYDTRTKLTWQRTDDSTTRSQSAAVSYCSTVPLPGSGWRLPKMSELLTLIDPTRNNPTIDTTAFGGTPATQYWTSSLMLSTAGRGWVVNFYNGASGDFDATTLLRVRCVR